MKTSSFFLAFSLCALSLFLSVDRASAITFDEIIGNLQQYEELYNDIDVKMSESYKFMGQPPREEDSIEDDEYTLIMGTDSRIHFVGQDSMSHFESNGGTEYEKEMPDEAKTQHELQKFDGKTTKLLRSPAKDGPGIVHIIDEKANQNQIVYPHTFLIRNQPLGIRLSILLRGHEAMNAHRSRKVDPRVRLIGEYVEEAERNGLKCHKVQLTEDVDGVPRFRRIFWLASERNLIPCYQEYYEPQMSNDIPSGVGEVTEWKEIEKGVWFPIAAQTTFYVRPLVAEGIQKVSSRNNYVVEEVSLDPKYDASFFQELKFPDGTAVYHVTDGKITNSYRVGAPETKVASSWWGSLFFWGNACVIVALVAAIVIRRRHRLAADLA